MPISMYFSVNYDEGYVVTITKVFENGYLITKPIKKFYHQGDALIFKEYDSKYLSFNEINNLIKNYDSNKSYVRKGLNKYRIYNPQLSLF